MQRVRTATMVAALVSLVSTTGVRAEDTAPKAQLKLTEGRKLSYTLERATTSNWGGGERTSKSTVRYLVTVGEVNDKGEAELSVAYKSLTASREGGENGWSFDLAKKPDETSEVDAGLRSAVAKPITVKIVGGRIAEISGFPEIEAAEDDRAARARRWRVLGTAGERTLRRDLELIFSTAVQGQSLETGKSYRVKREESDDDRQRRRFSRGFGSEIAFQLEGIEKNRARFSLHAVAPKRPEGSDAPRFDRKDTSTGEAIIALRAGVLLRLDLEHQSKISGESQGREFSIERTSTVKIRRQRRGKKRGDDGKKAAKPEKTEKAL